MQPATSLDRFVYRLLSDRSHAAACPLLYVVSRLPFV